MFVHKVCSFYGDYKNKSLVTKRFSHKKIVTMHALGTLEPCLRRIESAYRQVKIDSDQVALNILSAHFHNCNLVEDLRSTYKINCALDTDYPAWQSRYRSYTVVSARVAEMVSNQYQVLEIDRYNGDAIYSVVEKKDHAQEHAHLLFWTYYINNEWQRACRMALLMKPMWNYKLADYYEMMYRRMGGIRKPVK